jgi:hypothetical protein
MRPQGLRVPQAVREATLADIQPAGMLAQSALAVITRIFSDDCVAGLIDFRRKCAKASIRRGLT